METTDHVIVLRDVTPDQVRRVEQKAEQVRIEQAVRADYPTLCERVGRDQAFAVLAQRYHVSERSVERYVYGS